MIMIAPRARSRTIDFNLMAWVLAARSAERLNLFGATLSVPLCLLVDFRRFLCVCARERGPRAAAVQHVPQK